VDIDMIAGPSEILVIADDTADPGWRRRNFCPAEHDPRAAPRFYVQAGRLPTL
jgi:histidinol dehydrogenase